MDTVEREVEVYGISLSKATVSTRGRRGPISSLILKLPLKLNLQMTYLKKGTKVVGEDWSRTIKVINFLPERAYLLLIDSLHQLISLAYYYFIGLGSGK